ncbi:hypothetical protein PTKIN_Ptkin07bG0240100 [Pterospermum kingtungense]
MRASKRVTVAESYNGKFAVTVGLSILEAIKDGKLKLKLRGVALANSWISPEDFVPNLNVREEILIWIDTWQEVFAGSRGRRRFKQWLRIRAGKN